MISLSDLQAIVGLYRIKRGGVANLSVSQIINFIINLPDAKKNLSADKFEIIYSMYKELRKCKLKIPMNMEGYVDAASQLILEFDKVAPYRLYSGGNEAETILLMEEIKKQGPQYVKGVNSLEFHTLKKERQLQFFSWLKTILLLICVVILINKYGSESHSGIERAKEKAWAEGHEIGYSSGIDEGYVDGYNAGYEEGTAAEHEIAYSAGFEEGCELAADVATYKTMLELTGVFFDPKMGLYHKEGCQLLPEDAEFDLEEIAVENGLEPCHFCIMSADYSSGYQAGYAAGWVDRANDILSGE